MGMRTRSALPFALLLLASCGDRADAVDVEKRRTVVVDTEDSDSGPTRTAYPNVSGSTPKLESNEHVARRPPVRLEGPADVQFRAGDLNFAFLKVDEQVLALEPIASLSLAPGRHELAVRVDEDEPWHQLRSLVVEPGRRYKVRLSRANGWTIEDVTPQEVVAPPEHHP